MLGTYETGSKWEFSDVTQRGKPRWIRRAVYMGRMMETQNVYEI
jgi:hypothetical protein